jgi:Protein of unknown function (DUF1778)
MSQPGKKPTKKKPNPGLITSLHVQHPKMLRSIRAAAKLRGESVSKFLLSAGAQEAAKVLDGNCPSCGQSMRKCKTPATAAA